MGTEGLRNIFSRGIDLELLTAPVIARHILRFTSRPFGGRQQFPPEDIPFTAQDILLECFPQQVGIKRGQIPGEHRTALLVLDETLAFLAEGRVLERLPADDPPEDGQPGSIAYVVYNVEGLRELFAPPKESK